MCRMLRGTMRRSMEVAAVTQYTNPKPNSRQTQLVRDSSMCVSVTILWLLILALANGLFLLQVHCFYIDNHQSPETHQWNYFDQNKWRFSFKTCSLKAQSPIDIQNRYVIPANHLKLHFYNYDQTTRFKLMNAHHTIKMNPIGNAYELLANQAIGVGAIERDGVNSSSAANGMIDIMTADEFVDKSWSDNNDPADIGAAGSNQRPATGRAASEPAEGQGNAMASAAATSGSGSGSRVTNTRTNANKRPGDRVVHNNEGANSDVANGGLGDQTNHNNIHDSGAGNGNGLNGPAYDGAPTIKLDWLDDGNNEYKLRDIHFHWAERRDNGSEHAIDGRRAAMEMHLVHIKHGLDKSKISFTSDSVAVIAVLIESYRKSNADFNPIVNALSRINATEEPQELEYKSIKDLLPSTLTNFYTYSGSLTTPPCYQVVNWIVMSDRLYMNAKQIEMFRNLYAPINNKDEPDSSNNMQAELIMPNVRQFQPLNNRTILASFMTSMGRLQPIMNREPAYSGSVSLNGHSFSMASLMLIALSIVSTATTTIINNNNIMKGLSLR